MDRDNGQENGNRKAKRFRFTLRVKMNLLIAAGILVTSLCLLLVSYQTHSRQVNQLYLEEARRAARNLVEITDPQVVDWFRQGIDTDEFRDVRERAAAAGDPEIIENWLKSQPGFYRDVSPLETLQSDYQLLCKAIETVRGAFPLTRLYLSTTSAR